VSDFNLRALVRDVCATSTIPDPTMLAKEVNRRIRKADRDTALGQCLQIFVQHYVSLNRNSPSQSTGDPHMSTAGGSTSRKVTGIRDAWRRMLNDRIAVGSDPGAWKFLRDCTVTDLDYAASIREEHARRNADSAKRLRDLAELLTEHGATTVGALPESVLGPALGNAA
jgi:hypothetical protein